MRSNVLVPEHKLLPIPAGRQVAVARCDCGAYGCGVTDAFIQRTGDTVRWTWLGEKPMARDAVFDAAEYLREVRRAGADHHRETPERTTGRLVLERADRSRLAEHGLVLSVARDGSEPDSFEAWLSDPGRYQIIVDFHWAGREPEALADEVCRVLRDVPPASWPAQWLGNCRATFGVVPTIAGPGWRRWQLP